MTYASEVLADSPRIYLRLGDASGTTAVDSSGNGLNGTYSGSPTLGTTGLVTGSDTAVTFDGVNDYASVSDSMTFTAYTAEFWIKLPTVPPTTTFGISRNSASSTSGLFEIGFGGGQATAFFYNSDGFNTQISSGSGTIVAGNAYHIAITHSGTTVSLYVNGVLKASGTRTGTLTTTPAPLRIGARYTLSSFINATFDEVAFYTTALSGARILAHYNASLTPPATNVTPTFTAANTQTYAPEVVFGELDVTPGFTAANMQTFPPSVAAGAQRNITVTAAVERGRWHAAVIDPDRTAEVQPPRHRAGVTP